MLGAVARLLHTMNEVSTAFDALSPANQAAFDAAYPLKDCLEEEMAKMAAFHLALRETLTYPGKLKDTAVVLREPVLEFSTGAQMAQDLIQSMYPSLRR